MRETQKRIMEYSFKLPKLKEKVIAVALLFAVSASMLVTVSFAWLSISINPAVNGVNTTIAANGNLEIALATGPASTITAPGESKVGDSNLAILERNLTWGNLVNLADKSYGLSQMTLRPAKLNEFELATNPLHGPVYDEDGRVIMLDTSFGYSVWNSEFSTFEYTDKLGVRAITSMIEGEAGEASVYRAEVYAVKSDNGLLQDKYKALANNESYMNALSVVLVGYMAEVIRNGTGQLADYVYESEYERKQLENFRDLYEAFKEVLETEAEVYEKFLNLQAKVEQKNVTITAEEILALPYNTDTKSAATALKNMGYTATEEGFINNIDLFLLDYNIIKEDIDNIQGIIDAMPNNGKVGWAKAFYTNSAGDTVSLADIVNRFSKLGKCKVMLPPGQEHTQFTVEDLGGTYAMEMMSGTSDVIITEDAGGLLYNFEQRTGARLNITERSMSIKVNPLAIIILGTNNISVKVNVQTAATDNYFNTEVSNISATIAEEYGTPRLVPSDTYGLAIDFWVRTNASGGYLTLQGNVLTKKEDVEVTDIDKNGNTVSIYSLTREITQQVEGENGETTTETYTQSYDLYWLEEEVTAEDGTTSKQKVWYNAATHSVFELEDGENPKQKIETVETVIGYEGDNRVWEGDQHAILSVNSTTQGSGSCYVYYADTPEDQARSLELLKYMKIAFIDAEGNLLAEAYMDTARHYAANGKVIVPMVLENKSDSINLGTDDDGNPIIAITALEKNTPMLVTAIVYLDGDGLTNDYVLSSSDIEGQLNIQFGNNQLLHPIQNEDLYNAEMNVSATVSPNEFSYDDGAEMKTTVTVNIEGYEPNTVEAFFVRAINSQTGAKEEKFALNDADGDGVWTADYEFLYPGTYVLRSVTVDGIERELTISEGGSFPTVTVKGFEISNVNYNMNPTVLSVNNSYTGSVNLQFATNDPARMPKTVMGKFIREDGTTVNVNFTYDATSHIWSGNATFVSSGVYTMQYVVLDGEYTELDEGNRFTTDVKLGVKVDVSTNTKTNFVMSADGNYPKTLDMMVVILDNANNRITNVTDAALTYSLRGSTATTLYASLTWDAEKRCFVGSLPTTSGIWNFSYVDIKYGDAVSTLSTANGDAPVFTIIAPDPPEDAKNNIATRYQYLANATGSYKQTTQSGSIVTTIDGAFASVDLKYASAAQVYAKLVPASTNEKQIPVYVIGVASPVSQEDQTTRFTFAIPEGEWTLTDIRVWDVYDEDQTPYLWNSEFGVSPIELTEEQYLTGMALDVVDSTVAALYNVDISFAYNTTTGQIANKVVTFGKGASGTEIVSNFMDAHTIAAGDITITFTDKNGLIQSGKFGISDVALNIEYASAANSDSTYGGYITDSTLNPIAAQCKNFNVNGNVATLGAAATLQYAAQYKMGAVSYSVIAGENKTTAPSVDGTSAANAHLYEVWSNKPTVKVTGITTGTINVHTGTRGNDGSVTYDETISGNFNQKTDYSAVVFLAASGRDVNEPDVKLTLSGMPNNAFTATLAFPNQSSSSYNRTYEFTANNQEKSQKIGGGEDGSGGLFGLGATNPKIFPAGKHTVNQITVVYNGMTFTVDLSHEVTINQPQYPRYIEFTIGNSAYPGNIPEKIYVDDGETVQVKLPGANEITTTWTENITDTTTSAFTDKSNTTTSYYETWNDDCDGAMYQKYDKHVVVSEATETTSTYVRTWTLTGWKVGNTTYALGETITVTGSQTISAVLSYADGAKTTTVNLLTRTTKYYVVGSDTVGTPPSGYANVTSDPDNSNKDRWTQSSPNVVDVRTPKN